MKAIVVTFAKNQGGGGDYLNQIVSQYKGYRKIFPPIYFPKLGAFGRVIVELQALIIKLFINVYSTFASIDHFVFIYPQSMGYNLSSKLLKNAKKIDYWIIDTSFFCVKSYNSRHGEVCLKCLKQAKPFDDCHFFPRKATYKSYQKFQKQLRKAIPKIKFIVQTQGYQKLLKEKFGSNVVSDIYKMSYPALIKLSEEKKINSFSKYDFAFHGNNHPAKGAEYFIKLAEKMPDFSFFASFHNLEIPNNATSSTTRWDTGLKTHLLASKIICCPSLWTAPVEGAVLKSMLLKKPVALIENKMTLTDQVLPKDAFISLSGDIQKDTIFLKDIIDQSELLKIIANNGFNWAKNYVSSEILR